MHRGPRSSRREFLKLATAPATSPFSSLLRPALAANAAAWASAFFLLRRSASAKAAAAPLRSPRCCRIWPMLMCGSAESRLATATRNSASASSTLPCCFSTVPSM